MKILVTGALGHIGSYLIRDLGNHFPEASLVMVDNMMTQRYSSLFNLPSLANYKFIEGDVQKMDLDPLFNQVDVVVHLAAITDAVGSFDKAKEVWEKDEQVDDLTYIAMESVIDFLSKDKKNLDFSTHLIFATKNLERAGDHITNIAETVCYLVKGEYLKASRPKGKVIQE